MKEEVGELAQMYRHMHAAASKDMGEKNWEGQAGWAH